jgi:RHS repeat-associated protein/uncharacterized repeat protein (TIGR01451 family)
MQVHSRVTAQSGIVWMLASTAQLLGQFVVRRRRLLKHAVAAFASLCLVIGVLGQPALAAKPSPDGGAKPEKTHVAAKPVKVKTQPASRHDKASASQRRVPKMQKLTTKPASTATPWRCLSRAWPDGGRLPLRGLRGRCFAAAHERQTAADRGFTKRAGGTKSALSRHVGGNKGAVVPGAVPMAASSNDYPAPDWRDLNVTGPSGRSGYAAAYDPDHHVVVLFGGLINNLGTGGGITFLRDTWSFDGQTWTQRATTGPSLRANASLAWDGVNHRMILFGGYQDSADPFGGDVSLNDTWAWNGSTWTQLSPVSKPSIRNGALATWDSLNQRIVLYGGISLGQVSAETWVWTGSNWSRLATATDPGPGYRLDYAMTYDPAIGKTVLFGGWKFPTSLYDPDNGTYPTDTWAWNGSGWSQLTTVGTVGSRLNGSMAYDTMAGQVVLYGGNTDPYSGHLNTTWRFDGTGWTNASNVASSDGRVDFQLVYDPDIAGIVMFGGAGYASVNSADTWVATHSTPTLTKTLNQSLPLSLGQTAEFTVTIGNTSTSAMPITGLTDSLPTGLSVAPGASMWIGSPGGTICTSSTKPTCAASGHRVSIGGFSLDPGVSKTFTIDAIASGSPAGPANYGVCPSTGPQSNDASGRGYYDGTVVADNPMAYYRLDDSGSAAADVMNHAAGTYSSSGITHGAAGSLAGDADSATTFDGSSGSVTLPSYSGFNDLTQGLTLEAWVYPTGTTTHQRIIELGATGLKDNILLFRNATSNQLVFAVYAGTAGTTLSAIAAGNALLPNQWQHVVATLDANGNAALYRNGLQIATGKMTLPRNVTRSVNYIGRTAAATASWWTGSIDEATIYPAALSVDQILGHYQAGTTSGSGSNTVTALVSQGGQYRNQILRDEPQAYYRLDDANSTAVDSSPNNNAGTYRGTYTQGDDGALNKDPDQATDFDGLTGRVTVPAAAVPTGQYVTVEAWFKTSSGGGVIAGLQNNIFGLTPTRFNPILYVGTDGKLYGELWSGTVSPLSSSTSVTDGKWHHAVITGHPYLQDLYLDGTKVASGNDVPNLGYVGTNLLLGTGYASTAWSHLTTGWNSFNGTIDDVAIYAPNSNGFPAEPNIASHYSVGSSGIPSPASVTATLAPMNICSSRLGLEPWWSYASEPMGGQQTAHVNVSNGNLVVTAQDSTPVQAHGHMAFVLRRAYNSQDDAALSLSNGLGAGWQFNVGEADGTLGNAIGAGSLYVPTTEAVSQPLAVTLVDRDGTRHLYTPHLISTAQSLVGALAAHVLNPGSGHVLCVDQGYDPPPGVHLHLWRYVQVPGANCANGVADQIVGYAAESPDRVRYEFAATGELLDITDPAGVTFRYVYDTALAIPAVPLGKLRGIYESRSCTTATGTGTAFTLGTGHCRGFVFSYSGSSTGGIICPVPSGAAASTCAVDSAGRMTTYGFDTTSRSHLTSVTNPDGTSIAYTYGSSCGGTANQLCSASDLNGNPTRFTYASAPSAWGGSAVLPVLSTITDRLYNTTATAGATVAASYNSGQFTDVDTIPRGANCSDASNPCQRVQYSSIDGAGRVAEIDEGGATSTSGPWLHLTHNTWETSGAQCHQPAAQEDNNLCRQVSSALGSQGTGTPDEDVTFYYSSEGNVLSKHQQITASTSRDTTFGYHLQSRRASGVTTCKDFTVAGNGTVISSPTPTGVAGCPDSSTSTNSFALYTLVDHTQSLSARGNAAGSAFADYLASYQVDANATADPNTFTIDPAHLADAEYCTSAGAGTSNTGLVCEVDVPASAGVSGSSSCAPPTPHPTPYACGRSQYDGYGQKTTQLSAKAAAEGGNPTTFTYYQDSDTDLSGNTNAGGWLKGITDPTGHFVAFAYDAAGNRSRSWDRNATARGLDASAANTLASYPGNGVGGYMRTDFGPYPGAPVGSTAVSAPWRYPLASVDPLGHKTVSVVDNAGNPLRVCPPREYEAVNGTGACTTSSTYVIRNTYDANDQNTSLIRPLGATGSGATATTSYGYDAFGNVATETDPTGGVTEYLYDQVNRLTDTLVARSTVAADAPANCPQRPGDSAFPAGTFVCSSHVSYDGVDNAITIRDGAGQISTAYFDGVHRRTKLLTPRYDATYTTLRTDSVFDVDDNLTAICTPRQFTEGGSSTCAGTGAYSTLNRYNTAGLLLDSTSHRGSTALTTSYGYDADGNATSVTDPQGASTGDAAHTTTAAFDLLDRSTSMTAPRSISGSTVTAFTTSYRYDPVGNTLAVTMPNDGSSGLTHQRVTAYAYDNDNRLTDTVTGYASDVSGSTSDASLHDAVVGATAGASGASNVHTRRYYDPDGNVVGTLDAQAFASSASPPDYSYLGRVDYDVDGRMTAIYTARYNDGSASNQNSDSTQTGQCPTSPSVTSVADVPDYPSTVGVCVTRFRYTAADDRSRVTLPTTDGTHTNRYRAMTYTADHLLAHVDGPDPAADGQRLDGASGRPWAGSFTYDGAGRLVTNITGGDTRAGRTTPTQVTQLTYTADGLTQQSVETDTPAGGGSALSFTNAFGYDANGNQVAETNNLSQTATTEYFSDDLVSAEVDPAGNRTSYTYDNNGNPLTVKSPSANANDTTNSSGTPTRYTYTLDDLVATSTVPVSPDGVTTRTITYGYDPAGRKTSAATTEANPPAGVSSDGGTQSFAYYQTDRLKTVTGRGGAATKTMSYDAAGNPTSTADSTSGGSTVTASYYLDGMLRTADDGARTSRYAYDGSGLPTSRGYAGESDGTHTTTLSYSDAGQPTGQNADQLTTSSKDWTWAYDGLGRLLTENDPNGDQAVNAYRADSQLATHTVNHGATLLAGWSYGYDGLQRIASQTLNTNSAAASGGYAQTGTYSYTYDTAGRLSSFTDTNPDSHLSRTRNIGYDHDGNRTHFGTSSNGSSCTASLIDQCFTYNADDSLATSTDATALATARALKYDAAGRLTTDGCSNYNYDPFDRTAGTTSLFNQVTNPMCGKNNASYSYDGLDRQRSRQDSPPSGTATAVEQHYDGLSSTVEEEKRTSGSSPTPAELTYQLDASGTPLSDVADGTSQFLADDGYGNTTTVTSAAGAIACTARFDPYGTPERPITTLAVENDPAQHTCNTGTTVSDVFYHSARRDQTTGDYQMGSRTYDPAKAGFTTPDSYQSGQPGADLSLGTDPLTRNSYVYVNGDPVNYLDPYGHGCGWTHPWDCAKDVAVGAVRVAANGAVEVYDGAKWVVDKVTSFANDAYDNVRDEIHDLKVMLAAGVHATVHAVKKAAKKTAHAVKTAATETYHAVKTATVATYKAVKTGVTYCLGRGAGTCLKYAGAIAVGVIGAALCPETGGATCVMAAAIITGGIGGAMTCNGGSIARCAVTGAVIGGLTFGLGKTLSPVLRRATAGLGGKLSGAIRAGGSRLGNGLRNRLPNIVDDTGAIRLPGGGGGGSEGTTRVGRWMSQGEFDTMSDTGRVVEGGGGRTYVVEPPNPAAYTGSGPGSVYAEFDVPTSSLRGTSNPMHKVIPGPNVTTRIYGPPPDDMPPATCIAWVCSK